MLGHHGDSFDTDAIIRLPYAVATHTRVKVRLRPELQVVMPQDEEDQRSCEHNDVNGEQKDNSCETGEDCTVICQKARTLWMGGGDLAIVEKMYWSAWTSHQKSNDSSIKLPGEALALLYLQSSRVSEADKILDSLGYKCRLSRLVLDYPLAASGKPRRPSKTSEVPLSPLGPPCVVLDDFLTTMELAQLNQVLHPESKFWNGYAVEPPSPYNSYVVRPGELPQGCFLSDFLKRLQAQVASYFPSVHELTTGYACEIWAHCRPYSSGHQFHFDTDNEGCGAILKHPTCTCILYLSRDCSGGPSVITSQRVTSTALAEKAWLCHPKPRRLVIMKGRVLHGVVPGKGQPRRFNMSTLGDKDNRRVTLMIAFWKKIRTREHEGFGAARPWPKDAAWAQSLMKKSEVVDNRVSASKLVIPPTVDSVYESVPNGEPWTKSMGLPNYDEVFQF